MAKIKWKISYESTETSEVPSIIMELEISGFTVKLNCDPRELEANDHDLSRLLSDNCICTESCSPSFKTFIFRLSQMGVEDLIKSAGFTIKKIYPTERKFSGGY